MPTRIAWAAVAALSAGLAVAGCSGPAETPTASTSSVAPTTTSAAPALCADLFKTGAAVKPELGTSGCEDPSGMTGVKHRITCQDGRVMVYDALLKVYGFVGGVFSPIDTDAASRYTADYRKCTTGE
jgi:hypothetical protein